MKKLWQTLPIRKMEKRRKEKMSKTIPSKASSIFGTNAIFAEMKVTRFTFNNLISGIAPIAFKLFASC